MIDNRTTNKNYPLPHPNNIASQDVTRIASAITMIDADVAGCSASVETMNSTVQDLNARSIKIPSELVGEMDTELQNIQPRQYVVVNEDATGFSTVEGGGGEGGKKGEILVKKSDANFDTTWLDPRAILKKAPTIKETSTDVQLSNNCTMILEDAVENEADDVPRQGLAPRQINSDATADSTCSYILCDTIDDTAEDNSDIATAEKFGRVKIGSGINVNDGEISVPIIGIATADDFGMVKIGDGLAVTDGVVSAQTYPHADHENFGTVKPGADFAFDSNGALKLANKNEDIIYQKAAKKVTDNSTIRIVPTCAYYRAFINTDTLFSFDLGDFVPKSDISFDLEIVADGTYVISFGSSVNWELPCAGVNLGSTIIHFDKLLGDTQFRGTLKSTETPTIRLLTADTSDITENYICSHNGCDLKAGECMATRGSQDTYNLYNSTEGIWHIDFMRSTYVDYFEYGPNTYAWTVEYFYIEGSVDRKNWKRLLTRENVKLSTCTLDTHGYFKHYRIRARHMNFAYFRWYGFDVEDDLYELQRVMPIMQADSVNGFEITSSGLTNGNLYNLTNNETSQYANFETRLNGEFWVKYELPEAQTVDLIDLAARRGGGYSDRMPTWFKIEGSNDDTNWTTILERAYLSGWSNGESKQYWINNQTAYKFYRLLSIEQPTSYFALSRFRLYKKVDGIIPGGFIPPLSSASQAGYEVSASSQYDGSFAMFYAFDNNISTKWATSNGGGVGGWIQIKFPTETLCTTAWITARNDSSYKQIATDFVIKGSVDGVNFETLKTVTGQSWNQGEQKIFDFTNTVPYLYYRIEATAIQGSDNIFALSEVNFGTQMREYRRVLNRNEYLVPVMISDSQDGYIATSSSAYAPGNCHNFFDRSVDNCWEFASGVTTGWIQIQLPEAKTVNAFQVGARLGQNSGDTPRDYSLEASNDGENWNTLFAISNSSSWSSGEIRTHTVSNQTSYSYYRLNISNPSTNRGICGISLWDLLENELIQEY